MSMPTLSSRCHESIAKACPPQQWVELLDSLRREADDLDKLKAMVDGAALLRQITEKVETLLTSVTVGQKEAAELSGYSPDHIRRLERQGEIPNWGTRHAPRYPVTKIPVKGGPARFRRLNAQRAAS